MFSWRGLPLRKKFRRIAFLQIASLFIAVIAIVFTQDRVDRLTIERIEAQAVQTELANDIRAQIFLLERIEERTFEAIREPGFNPETTELFASHAEVVNDIRQQSGLLREALLATDDVSDVAIDAELEALDAALNTTEEDFVEFFLITQQLTDPQTGALVNMRNAGSELAEWTEAFLTPQVVLIQDLERSLVEVGTDEEWNSLFTAVQNVRNQTGRGNVIIAATEYEREIETARVLVERVSTLEEQSETSFTELNSISDRIITLTRAGEAFVSGGGEAASGLILLISIIVLVATVLVFGRTLERQLAELLTTATRMSTSRLVEEVESQADGDEIQLLRDRLNEIGVERDELEIEMRARIARATRDLDITSEIGRLIVEARDPIQMTNTTLEMLIDGFDCSQAQVFLVSGKTANLVATATKEGRVFTERRYSVPVGSHSAVGQVAVTGSPSFITSDDNPMFNEAIEVSARSQAQMAIPMRIGARVTGVLDVQADREGMLEVDLIAVFQIIADQLAIALESARLLSEVDTLEQRLGSTKQTNVGQRWAEFLRQQQGEMALAYQYEQTETNALENPIPEAMQEALERGVLVRTSNGEGGDATLSVPIRIRNQVIGVFSFSGPYLNELSDEDMALVETVIDRVGLALENLRLVQQATQRAEYEQIVNDITTQIVGSTDVNFILQTTVRELGRILGAPQTSVQLKRGDSDGRR